MATSSGEELSVSDNDTESEAPDVISSIYKSMSQIIEALNTDNLILNQQVNKIRGELEFVCNTLSTLKIDTQEISSTCLLQSNDLKKKISALENLQKHVMETRNMLIQTLDVNIKSIKKELSEIKNNKDFFRPFIKSIIDEETKQYASIIHSLEKRFEVIENERENHQKTITNDHIRKSVLQTELDNLSKLVYEEFNKQKLDKNDLIVEKIGILFSQFRDKLFNQSTHFLDVNPKTLNQLDDQTF